MDSRLRGNDGIGNPDVLTFVSSRSDCSTEDNKIGLLN
jgi:hypothetical protein